MSKFYQVKTKNMHQSLEKADLSGAIFFSKKFINFQKSLFIDIPSSIFLLRIMIKWHFVKFSIFFKIFSDFILNKIIRMMRF